MSYKFRLRSFGDRQGKRFAFDASADGEDAALHHIRQIEGQTEFNVIRSRLLPPVMDELLHKISTRHKQLISVEILEKMFFTALAIGHDARLDTVVHQQSRPTFSDWEVHPHFKGHFVSMYRVPPEDIKWPNEFEDVDQKDNPDLGVFAGVDCVAWDRRQVLEMLKVGFQIGWLAFR